MKKIKKNTVMFTIGGIGYGTIEVVWRGYTHWAMLIAGGICFIIFSGIAEKFPKRSLFFKAIICALSVTAVEIVFGVIFNIILKEGIWDYSNLPLNFMGQICLLYTILWGVLGFIFIPLAEALNKRFL